MTNRPTGSRLTQSSQAPRARLWWLVAVAVVAVVIVVVAIVRLGDPGPGGPGETARLEHVHGLATDPEDGALYAGTHYGLYRVTTDSLEGPVADRVHDFMGFTVAGPGHFIASGHPGHGQEGPGALGLIESTDGGKTWETRSLAGEADFHALEYRHDTAYGFNSMTSEFLVSADLEEWDVRSSTPMADFAVSPTEPATVVATTEGGPALSRDGGRTFELIDGAPLLLLVDWADDGTLVGVTPTGSVYVGSDGPASLAKAGNLGGQPEALHVEDQATMYAASSGRLLRSTDGAGSFSDYPVE